MGFSDFLKFLESQEMQKKFIVILRTYGFMVRRQGKRKDKAKLNKNNKL